MRDAPSGPSRHAPRSSTRQTVSPAAPAPARSRLAERVGSECAVRTISSVKATLRTNEPERGLDHLHPSPLDTLRRNQLVRRVHRAVRARPARRGRLRRRARVRLADGLRTRDNANVLVAEASPAPHECGRLYLERFGRRLCDGVVGREAHEVARDVQQHLPEVHLAAADWDLHLHQPLVDQAPLLRVGQPGGSVDSCKQSRV